MMKAGFDFGRTHVREMVEGKLNVFSSSYKELVMDAMIREDAENLTGDFIIKECPWKEIEGRRYAKGNMATFHVGIEEHADGGDLKTYQNETYINTAYSLAEAILRNEFKTFNEEILLGICVPATEFYSECKDKIKENLSGIYRVEFPVLKKSVSFQIKKTNVIVSSEGGASFVFARGGKDLQAIKTSNVMIIDCGHGSFDVMVCKAGKPDGSTARSFPIGGMTLEGLVGSALERMRIADSKDNIKSAIEKGFVMQGNVKKAVGVQIQQCKRMLAKALVQSMKKALVPAMMSETEINNFMPMGRCFIDGGEINTEFYTGSLIEYVKELWGHTVGIIHLPEDELSYEDLNADEEHRIVKANNLEVANVRGLYTGLQKREEKLKKENELSA